MQLSKEKGGGGAGLGGAVCNTKVWNYGAQINIALFYQPLLLYETTQCNRSYFDIN
jgi:hypothetical protein